MPLCVTSCLAHVNLPFRFSTFLYNALYFRDLHIFDTLIFADFHTLNNRLFFSVYAYFVDPEFTYYLFLVFPPKYAGTGEHRHIARKYFYGHTHRHWKSVLQYFCHIIFQYFCYIVISVFPSHFFQYFCHMILLVLLYLQALKCGWVSKWACDNFIIVSCRNMSATP